MAVNPAVLDPAGTVTVDGTAIAGRLLDRLTGTSPPDAAELSETEHDAELGPVNEFVVQVSSESDAVLVLACVAPRS